MALEEQLDVMAQYYGWSSFSMRNFVWSALRDGMHTALGLSECHFLAALFHDPIHPSLLTAWLLGDALVQHFVDAQAHFEQQEAEDAAAAASSPLTPAAVRQEHKAGGYDSTVRTYRDPNGCLIGERWVVHGIVA